MALFSVNQNGQWFTVKGYQASVLSNVGDIKINSDNQTTKSAAKKIWFEYKDAAGNKRSEVINRANGGRITVVPAAVMGHTAKCIKLTMNSGVNSGTPVNGEVYGLYINQRGYHGLGDNQFGELGAEVRYGSSFDLGNGPEVLDSAADLLNALALGFVRNLGADNDLYRVVVATASNAAATEVTPSTDLHSTSTVAIYILEKEQDWIQGTMQRENVNLSTDTAFLSNITLNTVERDDWGTLVDYALDPSKYATSNEIEKALTTASIPYTWVNTNDIADMEWFYLGEHGDTQRLVGYPYANAATIKGSIYKVDPTNAYGYDLVIIHHNYVGNGTFVQKSEQDIMIAMPLAGATTHTVANAFLGGLDDYFTSLSSTIGSAAETIEF